MKHLHSVCHRRGIRTIALAAITLATSVAPAKVKQGRDQLARNIALLGMDQKYVLGHLDPRAAVSREARLGLWEKDKLHWSDKGHVAFAEAILPVVADALDNLEITIDLGQT